MSAVVGSAGTGSTVAIRHRVPSASSTAVKPMTSSPGRTPVSPESQAESTTQPGGRASRSHSYANSGSVGQFQGGELRVVGAERAVGGDVDQPGPVQRRGQRLGGGVRHR